MRARPIVIVSFAYAPRVQARAFRWTALAERFAALGHPVDVVTSWLPDVPERELRNGVRVSRVGWRLLERARGGIGSARSGAAAAAPRTSKTAALVRWLWRALCWPDVTANWYFAALREAEARLAEHGAPILVSVSPTFTAVAVGRTLKRRHPKLDWFIDLGDPFSFLEDNPPNNRHLYARLNRDFEAVALREARAVTVTNARAAERYRIEFPESAAKITVIPPVLAADIASARAEASAGPVRVVFLGTLYSGLREPDLLLELFGQASHASERPLELHFYGETGAGAAAFARYRERHATHGRLFVHGVVDRERAVAATLGADVLVNLGNRTEYQLPSKVVEYAAAGKPVVNIASHRDDSSIEFFRAYPRALNIVASGGAPDALQVVQFRDFVVHPEPAAPSAVEAFLEPYRLEAVAARYLEIVA